MVSFKPPSILKYRRTASGSRTKHEQLGRASLLRANNISSGKESTLPRFFSTLRSSAFSRKFARTKDLSSDLARRSTPRRNIIRVSGLHFHSVNKPPIVIAGPSIPSLFSAFDRDGHVDILRKQPNSDTQRRESAFSLETGEAKVNQSSQGLRGVVASSTGSLGSWIEVSEVGSRPAVRAQVGLFSGQPSDSLLEGLQALLSQGDITNSDSNRLSLASAGGPELESEDISGSSFNEESFIRVAEAELGW